MTASGVWIYGIHVLLHQLLHIKKIYCTVCTVKQSVIPNANNLKGPLCSFFYDHLFLIIGTAVNKRRQICIEGRHFFYFKTFVMPKQTQ